jgi:hypothetical protein
LDEKGTGKKTWKKTVFSRNDERDWLTRHPSWSDIDPANPRGTIGGTKPSIPRHDEL